MPIRWLQQIRSRFPALHQQFLLLLALELLIIELGRTALVRWELSGHGV